MESREGVVLKPGLTWRSIMAIMYASLVFLPVAIYMQLVAGTTVLVAAAYITAILFSEFSRVLGAPLTKQELFIVYEMTLIAASAAVFTGMLFKGYLATSPMSWSFVVQGRPLPEIVPSWWAPTHGSPVYKLRTLMHPDWALPILLACLQYGAFYLLEEIALSMFLAYLFIEVEKLPFPFASIDASMVTALSERRPGMLRVFAISAIPGLIIGGLVFLPNIMGTPLVPLPWFDATFFTEKYMPGAMIGFGTDPSLIVTGFLVPFTSAFYMLIGSLAVWVFGNYFTLTTFASAFPEWVAEYSKGMTIAAIYQRSLLRVWICPQIGFVLALATLVVLRTIKPIIRAFKAFTKISLRAKVGAGYLPLPVIVGMYLAGTLGSVFTFMLLVRDWPWGYIWIPLALSLGFSFFQGLACVRAIGETGYSIYFPYVWHISVYATGYSGFAAWEFPPVIGGSYVPPVGGAPSWVNMIKAAYLTETRPMDFFKALLITVIVYHIFSFIYVDFFWRMAPIPSIIYPFVQIQWPAMVIMEGAWITRQIGVKAHLIMQSYAAMLGICIAGELASRYLGVPFSAVGLVTGTAWLPPTMIPVFIGSALSRFVFRRVFGRELWDEYRAVVVAGFLCGQSIIVGIGVAASLIARATWVWPY
ncbi:MAG: hypothetical protein DRN15_02055 [Thermoprotei archaeon]|nr:MAG: hypothetical protein DRN15_02055 [Thermoprotei archaeon]